MKRIPFTPEMFRAWREGRKTVTRRLINPQPKKIRFSPHVETLAVDENGKELKPYYRPGERVVVVTRWAAQIEFDDMKPSKLPNDYIWLGRTHEGDHARGKWRPARFVPLHLENHFPQTTILSVRPEWLHDITEEDAMKEGMIPIPGGVDYVQTGTPYRSEFATTWNRIHKDKPWESNSLVWRYELAPPGDEWMINDQS